LWIKADDLFAKRVSHAGGNTSVAFTLEGYDHLNRDNGDGFSRALDSSRDMSLRYS
jgi:hypothetical protein